MPKIEHAPGLVVEYSDEEFDRLQPCLEAARLRKKNGEQRKTLWAALRELDGGGEAEQIKAESSARNDFEDIRALWREIRGYMK